MPEMHHDLTPQQANDRVVRSQAVQAAASLISTGLGLTAIKADGQEAIVPTRYFKELTSVIGVYIKTGTWTDPDPDDE